MDKITYKSVVSKLRAKRFWLTTEYDKVILDNSKSSFTNMKDYNEGVSLYRQRYSDLRCEAIFYAELLGKSPNKLWLSIWQFNAKTVCG